MTFLHYFPKHAPIRTAVDEMRINSFFPFLGSDVDSFAHVIF